jgi:hypothetical protein
MEKIKYFIILLILSVLSGCGDSPKNEIWTEAISDSLMPPEANDSALREKILRERIQSGDTLIKTPNDLMTLLPLTFKGYTLEDTSAQYLEFDNRRMTEARIVWGKGDETVTASLVDYNRNLQTWNGLAEMYRAKFVQDNAEELSAAWQAGMGENFAWINFLKEEPHIRLSIGLSYRYLLTLEFTGRQDTSGLYTFLRQADWSKIQ